MCLWLISWRRTSGMLSYWIIMLLLYFSKFLLSIPFLRSSRVDERSSASWPIGKGQSVFRVANKLTFDLGCGHCFGIRSTIDMCRFCVLPLHREVGGVRQHRW